MRATIKRLLPKSPFARSVSVLAGGTVVGQAIVVLASPVLTHLYTPVDFGLVAVFASLLGALSAVAALRYELAIPLPKRDHEALHLVILCILSTIALAITSAIAVALFRHPVSEALNSPGLAPLLWLLPVAILVAGTYRTLNYWAIRKRAFQAIARTKLVQSTGMVAIQIGGFTFGPWALLTGLVFGQAAGIRVLISNLPRLNFGRKPRRPGDQSSLCVCTTAVTGWGRATTDSAHFRLPEMRKQALKYKNLPLISTWAAFASAIGANSIAPLLAVFYGAASAGFYAIAARVVSMPMTVIGKAVSDVFYKEATVAHEEGRLGTLVVSVADQLIRLAVPVAILGFLVSPRLVPIVFGEDWAITGDIVQAAIVWALMNFVVSSTTPIYPIINKLHVAMFFEVTIAAYAALAIVLGSYLFDSLVASIWLLSGGNAIIYVARMVTTLQLTNSSITPLIWSSVASASLGAAACSPLIIFHFAACDGQERMSSIELASMATSCLLVLGLIVVRWRTALKGPGSSGLVMDGSNRQTHDD